MPGQINLFNRDLLPRKTPISASLVPWVLGAGVLACASVAVWVSIQTKSVQTEARKAAEALSPLLAESQLLQSRINATQPDAHLQREVRDLERKLQLRQQALMFMKSEGEGGESGFSQRLLALSRQSQEGLWLTHIEMTGSQLSLQGQALSAEKLPRWMAALRREQSLSGTAFEVVTMVRPAPEPPMAQADSVTARSPAGALAKAPPPYQFVLRSLREPGAGIEIGKTP